MNWREKAVELVGTCIHCGFSDKRALTVVHKDGYSPLDGSYQAAYNDIVSGSDRHAVMCYNCVAITKTEGTRWTEARGIIT